jgi:hypothetical protein
MDAFSPSFQPPVSSEIPPWYTGGTDVVPPVNTGGTDVVPQVRPDSNGIVLDQPGDTDLYGGPNQDIFVFQDGSGFDLVFGFDPSDTGDVITIDANVNGTGLESVDQLAVIDTEYGALVDLGGGNAFVLADVSLSQLDPSDFTVVPPIDSGSFFF